MDENKHIVKKRLERLLLEWEEYEDRMSPIIAREPAGCNLLRFKAMCLSSKNRVKESMESLDKPKPVSTFAEHHPTPMEYKVRFEDGKMVLFDGKELED